MHHTSLEMEEYGLSREQVLSARARDARPAPPLPQWTRIDTPSSKKGTARLSIHVLGSGSQGNCEVIAGPEGAIMVDCGFSKKEMLARLALCDIAPEQIKALVITHEHSDHVSGVDVVSRGLKIPVLATTATFDSRSKLKNLAYRQDIQAGQAFSCAGIRVDTFSTSHDVADPIGLRFSLEDDSIGLVTDTGYLTQGALETLCGVRVLALESNHDPDMLKFGPYPAVLKARIASDNGHLSNLQSADALRQLADDYTECVIGMHLSQVNNLPEKAREALEQTVRSLELPLQVAISNQGRPTSVV